MLNVSKFIRGRGFFVEIVSFNGEREREEFFKVKWGEGEGFLKLKGRGDGFLKLKGKRGKFFKLKGNIFLKLKWERGSFFKVKREKFFFKLKGERRRVF